MRISFCCVSPPAISEASYGGPRQPLSNTNTAWVDGNMTSYQAPREVHYSKDVLACPSNLKGVPYHPHLQDVGHEAERGEWPPTGAQPGRGHARAEQRLRGEAPRRTSGSAAWLYPLLTMGSWHDCLATVAGSLSFSGVNNSGAHCLEQPSGFQQEAMPSEGFLSAARAAGRALN